MAVSKKTNKKEKKNNKKKVVNEQLREVAPKNYFILGVIFIIALVVVIGLRNWYISYENYQLTKPVLEGKLSEVKVAELDNYLTENSDAILYIEVSEDCNSREVAKKLYDVVKERNLTERVVYLNLSSEDEDAFFKSFNDKYMKEGKLKKYPALVLFDDGKVAEFVARDETQALSIGKIEQLFDEYELGD